jgi:type II secretory pathway predicted ATPase ExeA
MLAHRFELSAEAAHSKAVLLAELEAALQVRRTRGEITALVIDEAQTLSPELLEEVRLLANIETATEKLLPLVLAGQPELSDRLEDVGLRQLKQRVALRCAVAPFELAETASYIAHRIRIAGGEAARAFTREAVTLIHEHSRGIPRTISVMCDNALVSGFALNRLPVDREVVLEVARDFCLHRAAAETPTVTAAGEPPPMAVASASLPAGEQGEGTGNMVRQVAEPKRFSLFGFGGLR